VVKTAALVNALRNNTIAGAALDVLENEKINNLDDTEKGYFQFLANQPNVLMTPHIAGYSHEAFYKMSKILLEKLDI
jgi:D-3-phosphoglycerate dehydrogenase